MDDVRRPYRPADPAAYRGRPRLAREPALRAAGVQAGLVLLLGAWHNPLGLAVFAAFSLVNVRVLAGPLLSRRGDAPLVVDRPGVFVADDAGGGRLVHWEAIRAVVLVGLTSARSGHRRQEPGVALRLRSHPSVLAIRRPLDGWTVDRAQLTAAVARFAPPGVAVTEEETPDVAPSTRDVVADVAGRAFDRLRPVRARPARTVSGTPDPGAYVARDAAGGERLVVAADGVRLGPGLRRGRPVGPRFFRWDAVAALVLLDVEEPGGWRRAVGVLPAGAPAAWHAGHLADLRVAEGWTVDRPGLERAVRLHAPQVPVADGPPARRTRAADVAAVLVRAYRTRQRARPDPERRWRA